MKYRIKEYKLRNGSSIYHLEYKSFLFWNRYDFVEVRYLRHKGTYDEGDWPRNYAHIHIDNKQIAFQILEWMDYVKKNRISGFKEAIVVNNNKIIFAVKFVSDYTWDDLCVYEYIGSNNFDEAKEKYQKLLGETVISSQII